MTDRTPANIARDDQAEAASAHTLAAFGRHAGVLPGGGIKDVLGEHPPVWLVRLFERHNQALGTGYMCSHLADGQAVPRAVMAWEPGSVVCLYCAADGALLPARGSDAEYRCDGCGEVHREGLHTSLIHVPPVTIFYLAVCDRCAAEFSARQSGQ